MSTNCPPISISQLQRCLDTLSKLRVAVVGETILDEYAYCEVLGKSGKEPTLVAEHSHVDVQAGGVLAIANHLVDFCDSVQVISALGEYERREHFVRGALREKITATFATVPKATTIVKRRYLDAYCKTKLLGVYKTKHAPPSPYPAWNHLLRDALTKVDVVIVADYGHGLLSQRCADTICEMPAFLALNCQMNASNMGYHVVSKYKRANFLCVHEGEIRLDARDRTGPLEPLLAKTQSNMNCDAIMITRGKRGTLLRDDKGSTHLCPAFASSVVERVGAGDAVLALSSIASAAGLSPTEVNVLANLAGARLVSTVGNGLSVRKEAMLASARALWPAQLPPTPLTVAKDQACAS